MRLRFLLLLVVVCLVFSSASVAQTTTISGVVLDTSRKPLSRATVRLLDSSSAELARQLTDVHGRFEFTGITGAGLNVEVSLTGFATGRRSVTPGEHAEVSLPVAPVRERIVVSATRGEAPTAQLGASVTVVDEDEIARRRLTLVADLLAEAPGAAVARNGAVGTLGSLFIRGGESDHVKVLLDGIPLNEPGGAFNFGNLSAENLERIELVRGPQSALFGSEAMAGAVQLFTRRGQAERRWPRLFVSGEGGNDDTWRASAGLSGGTNRFDYSFHAANFGTNNREPNNVFRNTTISGNFGFTADERNLLRLILRGEAGRVGTPGASAFGRPDLDAFFRRGDGYAGLSYQNQTTNEWSQRLLYTLSKSRQLSRNLVADPPFTPRFGSSVAPFEFFDFTFDSLSDLRRHHTSYQSDWRAGSTGRAAVQHLVSFAFEWDREVGFLVDRLSGEPPIRARRNNFGWVYQHQILWSRFFLTVGGRVEDNASFGTAVVPRASVAYLLRQGLGWWNTTKLKFNFGLGIKEPSFFESFSPTPAFRGNPDLRPERSRSFDFGVEQRFWHERGKIELNWFDNRFRDLIAFQVVSFSPFTGSFFNLGRSTAKGGEVVIELVPRDGLRAIGAYTYLDSQVTESANPTSPIVGVGRPLLRRPRHSGSLRWFWDWQRFSVTSALLFVGRRTDSDFSALVPALNSNPGYVRWDLGGSYDAAHRVSYFVVFENLANEEYMETLGFPARKFAFRAGARANF